ncbi:MAG: ABC transporter ATP-binding protein, partial [Planctomycetota bacterium]
GYENIFLNGAILGLKRRFIQERLDAIVGFAEVEDFLDLPVKRYSSGMYVRLAFAVAAHLDCDVLLIDEVLAVGDQAFREKCLQRMEDEVARGRTLVIVSHDGALMQRFCDRCVLLERGHKVCAGEPEEVYARYAALS